MPGTTSNSRPGALAGPPARPSAASVGSRAALAVASVLGVLYAALSAYWGSGGHALLSTIGGTLAREGRAGNPGLLAIVWLTVTLKLVAVGAGLTAVVSHRWIAAARRRIARRVAWAAAIILTLYGGVLTITGLLVQSGAVHASASADHRALRWHALVWDPWFLAWGVALAVALAGSRARAVTPMGSRGRGSAPARTRPVTRPRG